MTASSPAFAGHQAFLDAISRFLPPPILRDRDATNQARMFLISHLFGPFLGGSVPLALAVLDPTPGPDIAVLAASIAGFWAFPLLLRAGVPYSLLVVASIVNLNFAILWSCYFYGGVASPTMVWMLIVPILSVFYIGGQRQLQPHLLLASLGCILAFVLAYALLPPAPNDVPHLAMLGLGATSALAALCYIAGMAIYYAKIFDAGVDLEDEVRRRRQMLAELRKAVAAADRASAAKSEFLARMSHELRTPLNAILGYGQILREEAIEDGDHCFVKDIDRILDAGAYLLRLIGVILDLSRIEAGRMTFDLRSQPLGPVVEAAVAERHAAIVDGGNAVAIDLPADLPEPSIDAERLRAMVSSILENATRFTRDGTIGIAARRREGPGGAQVALSISDTGAGIAPHDLATLFETFSTSRDAADSRYGGTGLSLAICRKLCLAMNGDLLVESVLGRGSTFTILLPVGTAAAPGSGPPGPDPGSA